MRVQRYIVIKYFTPSITEYYCRFSNIRSQFIARYKNKKTKLLLQETDFRRDKIYNLETVLRNLVTNIIPKTLKVHWTTVLYKRNIILVNPYNTIIVINMNVFNEHTIMINYRTGLDDSGIF